MLIPSQSLTFLGFNLNPVSQEKRGQLESLCTEAMNGKDWSIRFVAKVIGKVVSALPGVEFGKFHCRNLERDKIYALSAKQGYYDALMQLSPAAKEELKWGCDDVGHGYRRIQHATYSQSFKVDASDSGWGIACTTDESLLPMGFGPRNKDPFISILIPRCLEKEVCDQAEGVFVVPAWPTQTWYTRFVQMLISQPVVMVWTKETSLLIHPSGPRTYNVQGCLKLMACQVSGDTTKCRAFLNTL